MAGLNVVFTWLASPYLGYWAPAIAYVVSITLGNGIFMNWYYHVQIGLDMSYFWKRNIPVVIASATVLVACMGIIRLVPVSGWVHFFFWGVAYSFMYTLSMWLFVLDGDEKAAIVYKVPFLKREA